MSPTIHRKALGLIIIAGVGLACSDPGTAPMTAPDVSLSATSPSNAPSSPGWNEQARALVAANNLTAYAAGRLYGVLGVAQYLAVVDADGHSDVEGALPENGWGAGGRALLEARRGAVAGASAEVLSFFFPALRASFEQRVETEAGSGNVHPQFTRGLEIGRTAGRAMVARAQGDHFTTAWVGTIPTGPGKWTLNPGMTSPAGAMLVHTTPYLLTSPSQFRSPPPPAFGTTAFDAAVAEVRRFADTRTPEQRAIAIYWNFPGGTPTPPGYWNQTAANYIEAYALDERAATHVFALMHAAMFDAQIACWDTKHSYWVLRPSQADPGISLTFALPNHPSYPSGHSCLSAAAGTVLSDFFPDRTAELDGWVTEAGLSRIYAGIHYRFDIIAGQDIGRAVGQFALGVDRSTGLLEAMR